MANKYCKLFENLILKGTISKKQTQTLSTFVLNKTLVKCAV